MGTHPQPFDRLLKELDKIAKKKKVEFFAQSGNCNYTPKNFPFKKFLSTQEFEESIGKADIVISHGGAGTIISSMLQGKRLVVVPRLQRFAEHTNDHQLDLAKSLSKEGKAIALEDIEQLEEAIERAAVFKPRIASNKRNLIEKIRQFLESS